jgi:hypothetical protein
MKTVVRLSIILASGFFCPNAHTEPALGRLLTTPAERANLDHLRSISKTPDTPPEISTMPDNLSERPAVAPPVVYMQGYVKRNDGKKSTVWVNGEPVQENTSTNEVQVGELQHKNNKVPLKLKGTGKNFNLKAGQAYVPETGNISEFKASTHYLSEESGSIGNSEAPADTR